VDTESFHIAELIEVRFPASVGLHGDDGAIIVPKRGKYTRGITGIVNLV
jgi:hypothetical protein